VAHHALLVGENLPPRRRVAGRIEVVEGVEKADEIAGLFCGELGARDAQLLHALRHPREVIPHGRGHVEEGMRPRALREIRTDLAAHAIDRVTLLAALGREDL
jgi:hypothetical protein